MASNAPESPGAHRGDTVEIPAKKRRRTFKYKSFLVEEKELLMQYEKLESRTRKILKDSTMDKFFSNLRCMPEASYILDRFFKLMEKTSLDPIYIGLFGSTGAGKTSLLNTILEKRFFLPVSGSTVCTSCVVEIHTSRAESYEAKIHLLSDEEWRVEMEKLVKLAQKCGDDADDSDDDDDDDDEGKEAIRKLQAVYGYNAETKSYEELLKAKPVTDKRYILRQGNEAQISGILDLYIRCQRNKDKGEPSQDGDARLWPLIKKVEVTIPRPDVIPEGVVFVDIPGTGDFNDKRDQMWKESINACSVIWIISGMVRVQGEKVQETLLAESIKAYQAGKCSDITLVVTKSDDVKFEEYKRERKVKNKSLDSEHDAILENNESVKLKRKSKIMRQLKKQLPSDSEILDKADLVYTVSAREYWDEEKLTKEETEIPKLRDSIRQLYLKERKKLLMNYVIEVYVIFALAQNLSSTEDLKSWKLQQNNLETFVMKGINELEKEVEKCFAQIEQPLKDGIQIAKKSHQNIVDGILNRTSGKRGYHRTLKALCQKNGMYVSRTFARLDINNDLARPIYEKINPIFGAIFRDQAGTRATLKGCLETFRCSVQEKFKEGGKKKSMADSSRLDFLVQETNVILNSLDGEILKSKAEVYQSLPLSIQNDLQPYYEAAGNVRGINACQTMQNIIKKNIEKEVSSGMFEEAAKRMKDEFQKLKDKITRTLNKNFSNMLNLALSQREELAEKLPDLQNQYKEIKDIYNKLHGKA
ncbi:nuclear GTPase SLIP-GC-like [Alligator sinensis]|uniref:Nuclear GTPase SLIP-GC-like n=1 Tax=Alligator sinensis TaxID=38654 RepID=A0A1U7SA26_ALLSI|nr:nuclear GTPase SLIP-GC-like [Alligator sinensis]XP_025071571.1 nuclear GTPase SLIP-GC-like [Alligator sinensis]